MEQTQKEILEAKINYLKEQIKVLGKHAIRDNADNFNQTDISLALVLASKSASEETEQLFREEEVYFKGLHLLSSYVDKTKSGGWIAAHSTVYRVERHGRSYRNTDLISVQMVDKDYNGTDKLEQRAREIAAALNAL
jgi:hypothetical protein